MPGRPGVAQAALALCQTPMVRVLDFGRVAYLGQPRRGDPSDSDVARALGLAGAQDQAAAKVGRPGWVPLAP